MVNSPYFSHQVSLSFPFNIIINGKGGLLRIGQLPPFPPDGTTELPSLILSPNTSIVISFSHLNSLFPFCIKLTFSFYFQGFAFILHLQVICHLTQAYCLPPLLSVFFCHVNFLWLYSDHISALLVMLTIWIEVYLSFVCFSASRIFYTR